MKNENELVQLFQIEELEQRYEMGWIKSGSVEASANSNGTVSVTAKLQF